MLSEDIIPILRLTYKKSCANHLSRGIHKETNGSQYVISLTTNRTTSADQGRHFLFDKYGIKVPTDAIPSSSIDALTGTVLHCLIARHRRKWSRGRGGAAEWD